MKVKSEIYCIKFNKFVSDKDIHYTTYVLGAPVAGTFITPVKIVLSSDKKHITTFFNNDTNHTISYTEDVQIFKRKVDEPHES